MEERQVSVDGEPRPLPDPFVVVATQNPVEYEGTYPLPEAQLDRFLLKLTVPLPPREDEDRGARPGTPRASTRATWPRPGCGRSPSAADLARRPGRRCARVQVAPEVLGYVVDLSRATRAVAVAVSSASRRAAPPRCWPPRGPGPGCPAATTSPPTT